MLLFMDFFGRVTILSEFLPPRSFIVLLMYSNNRTSFDTSAYYADRVITYKYYYHYYNFMAL